MQEVPQIPSQKMRLIILEGCAAGLTQDVIATRVQKEVPEFPRFTEHNVREELQRMRTKSRCSSNAALVATLRHKVGSGPSSLRRLDRSKPPKELEQKELIILEELSKGANTAMIAKAVFLSEQTVRSKIAELLRRYGASTREQLVHFYTQWGLE